MPRRALLLSRNTMLIVGTDKSPILENLPSTFLIIDDGPLIDALPSKRATHFDTGHHSFNPVRNIDYLGARDFISTIDAIFPEGANTLTRKNSNFVLLKALLDNPKNLATLIHPSDDPAVTDAYQKIQTILFSPVLDRVLNRPTNMSFKGTIYAKLDRAKLGDFDCFVLANFLISKYRGTVVIPDFGFYGAPHHISLIRQNRLIAGLNVLDESVLKNQLLLMNKIAAHCLPQDAETLAEHAGIARGTNAFSDFVAESIK